MNRRVLLILGGGVAAVALIVVLLSLAGGPSGGGEEIIVASVVATPTPAPPQRIILLFAGTDGMLYPEVREVPLPAEIEARMRVVVQELLSGPTQGLRQPIPYKAELGGVFVDIDGNGYVDLTAPPEPLHGSHTELLLTYSVVDSVLLNCPDLAAVQLLFSGREVDTLTGHLDLSRPLTLNKKFVAGL
ncbi:MAG: GerMN domain-containing protein [bacterium]|nr:GerMN domain-containing protein [bacterium]